MPTYRRYTERQRVQALALVRDLGGNLSAAADATGIPKATLHYWLAAQDDSAGDTAAPFEISYEKNAPPFENSNGGDGTDDADFRLHLPRDIAGSFDRSLGNEEITSLNRALALIDVRTKDALAGVEIGDSTLLWQRLRTAADAVLALEAERATAAHPTDPAVAAFEERRRHALRELIDLIDRGVESRAAWDEILTLIERRRRLAAAETRRRHLEKDVLTPTYVLRWQEHVTNAIRKYVQDPAILQAIVEEVERAA